MTNGDLTRKLAALRGDANVHLSPATRATYRSHWNSFNTYCEANGLDALPADENAVLGFLLTRFEGGLSLPSLRTARHAIGSKHNLAGLPNPTKSDGVREVLRLLTRKAKSQGRGVPKQAPAIRLEHIERYADNKPDPDEIGPGGMAWGDRQKRVKRVTVALLYTMHNALLRRTEAASARWQDIEVRDDGSGMLTIPKSKTSHLPMTRRLSTHCVRALLAIRPDDYDPAVRVFGAKRGRTIQNMIQRAVGFMVPGCTGHSLRVGGAQDLTIRGASLQQLKEAGGWASLTMPAYYASQVEAEHGAGHLLED